MPSGVPSSKYARRYHPPSQPCASMFGRSAVGLLGALVGKRRVVSRPRQIREAPEVGVQEPRQPHALSLAAAAHEVHAVVPIAAPHQRKAVLAEPQTVLDGADAVLVDGRVFGRRLRLVVVRVLARIDRAPFEKRHALVEHGDVARRRHVPAGRVGQPEKIVGEVRADPVSTGRVPPMLNVALRELPPGAADDLLARQRRARRAPAPSCLAADP